MERIGDIITQEVYNDMHSEHMNFMSTRYAKVLNP